MDHLDLVLATNQTPNHNGGGGWGSKVIQWHEDLELKILTFIFPLGPNVYLDIRVTI